MQILITRLHVCGRRRGCAGVGAQSRLHCYITPGWPVAWASICGRPWERLHVIPCAGTRCCCRHTPPLIQGSISGREAGLFSRTCLRAFVDLQTQRVKRLFRLVIPGRDGEVKCGRREAAGRGKARFGGVGVSRTDTPGGRSLGEESVTDEVSACEDYKHECVRVPNPPPRSGRPSPIFAGARPHDVQTPRATTDTSDIPAQHSVICHPAPGSAMRTDSTRRRASAGAAAGTRRSHAREQARAKHPTSHASSSAK